VLLSADVWVRWELEEPFDGQLCQECLCQKSLNPLIPFKVTIDHVGVPFLRHSVYSFPSRPAYFAVISNYCLRRRSSTRLVYCQKSATQRTEEAFIRLIAAMHCWF